MFTLASFQTALKVRFELAILNPVTGQETVKTKLFLANVRVAMFDV